MGQWIEFRKEARRQVDLNAIGTASIDKNLTFKRNLHGLQNGGLYDLNGKEKSSTMNDRGHSRHDSISNYSKSG